MRTLLRTRMRPMTAGDIVQVADIERESFPSMWPQTAYKRELSNNIARYIVLTEVPETHSPAEQPRLWSSLRRIVGSRPQPAGPDYLLGFIGLWLMAGEAHIVTVAVRERYRRMGIGERLLIAATELAAEYDQQCLTLEVRSSNAAAQLLYAKYGFVHAGLRKRYYTDDNEDAVIMTTPDLASDAYRSLFAQLRETHRHSNPDLWN